MSDDRSDAELEIARLREQLASVLESSSWRFTRPLRRLRRSHRPESIDSRPSPPAPAAATAETAPEPHVPLFVPPGHFYSPIVDPAGVGSEPRRSQVWPSVARSLAGVDWRPEAQLALCRDVFAHQRRLDFRDEASEDPTEYFALNDQYPPLDAWVLEGMLRWLRPSRMIEIGSGFSSLVSARVNRDELEGRMRFTCI